MATWVCATCGPVPAGAIRHLDHDSPHGHERHECGSSAGLDWTKTKEHEMTTTPCGKCGKTDDDGIFVVVCRHVLEDDFDEDDDGKRTPRIHVYAAPASKPGATLHLCREAGCPETELCAPCATNL